MGEISLGALLARKTVPDSGTRREQIVYLEMDRIDDDPRNFYELSGIEELAANIQMLGLQQPIRVRPNPDQEDRVIIVSGHRRRAAIRKLMEEDRERWHLVPCIQEAAEESEEMQELRLIFANKDIRKMKDADIARQAERTQELLTALADKGYKFEGRMRDHVAQILQVSKSKLSRLNVIQKNLAEDFQKDWKAGKIPESTAYRIAQEDQRTQRAVWLKCHGWLHTMTAELVDDVIERTKKELANPPKVETAKPSVIGGFNSKQAVDDYLQQRAAEDAAFTRFIQNHGFTYFLKFAAGITKKDGINEMKNRVGLVHVCHRAGDGDRWDAMPNGLTVIDLGQNIRRSWAEVWDAVALEALHRCNIEQSEPEETLPVRSEERISMDWHPASEWPEDGTVAVVVRDWKVYRGEPDFDITVGIYKGGQWVEYGCEYLEVDDVHKWLPIGNPVTEEPPNVPTIPEYAGIDLADPNSGLSGQLVFSGWMPGGTTPSAPCSVVAVFDLGTNKFKKLAWWDGQNFLFKRHGEKINQPVVKWMALPPDEEDVEC